MRQKIIFPLLILLFCCHFTQAQFNGNQSFDGISQSVSTPIGMLNGATIFTMECWVKTTESRTGSLYWQQPTLFGIATNGGPSGDFGVTTNNGFIGMWSGLNNAGDNSFLSTTVQINDNNWHHVATTNDGATIKLYVDGTYLGSLSSGLGLTTSAAPLTIASSALDFGFSGNVGTRNFFHQGIFDEVRFSNNVRYNNNFSVPTSAFTADANTVALYHFDNGCVSGLVPDASANANNGKPFNLSGSCTFTLPPAPTIGVNQIASNINKVEYFYDNDPGFANGINLPITNASDVSGTYSIATPNSTGVHRIYVRTKNTNQTWSQTNASTFYIVPASFILPSNAATFPINKAEYFFDADPGLGNATDLPIATGTDVSGNYSLNIQSLTQGVHRLYVRIRNNLQRWSVTNVATFFVLSTTAVIPANAIPASIAKAEYFIDTDPGFGNGTNFPVTNATDVSANILVNVTGLNNGVHYVYLRSKDANGEWSSTNVSNFSILAASFILPSNPIAGNITKLEYFFDTDPGFGNGKTINVAPTIDLANYSFNADVTGITDGMHTLFVRTFDDWGATVAQTFTKGVILPLNWLSFTAKAVTDSVLLNWQTTNEINANYFMVERSADGQKFKAIGNVSSNNLQTAINNYNFTDKQPLQGINYYRIKQIDKDGKYSYSVVIAIKYLKGNGLITVLPNPFHDAFNLNINSTKQSAATIAIVDLQGKIILKKSVELQIGINNIRVDGLSVFANGNYLLQIINDGKLTTNKLLKQ